MTSGHHFAPETDSDINEIEVDTSIPVPPDDQPTSGDEGGGGKRNIVRLLRVVLGLLILLTVVSTAILWPESRKQEVPSSLGQPAELVNGTVSKIESGPCLGDPTGAQCDTVTVSITSGPDDGNQTTLNLQQGPGQPSIEFKDKIVLGRAADQLGGVTYYFSDFQRQPSLIALGLFFAAIVVLVARWRGIGALIGLGVTWVAITQFMLPSILEGNSPVLVTLTCSALVVLIVLYVAHGISTRTTTAVIGTLTSLVLTGLLAMLAVKLAHVTGLSSEEVTYIQSYAGNVDIQGLLLAGMILGSLGVMNDMTVTQASTVWELHIAQPLRTSTDLFKSAMRVGRDHIASTVYTLALAYTGAALPLLILFSIANRKTVDVLNSSVVSEELVHMLVGGIGLILSVPITTLLAAIVVKRQPIPVEGSGELGVSTAGKRIKWPFKRKQMTFEQAREKKMSRRERKFWSDNSQ